jgi:hypothetical protein
MAEQDQPFEEDAALIEKRLARRERFFAVVYRIVLVAGLLGLIATVVLLFATDLFSIWILLLPVALIALGIILARVEYRLDMRLYAIHKQGSTNGDN